LCLIFDLDVTLTDSKPGHFAVRILEAFELAPFFAAIYGDKLQYDSHATCWPGC
jgi:phosphoglycolate phosphatase-like HAD superfamily hydrolase